jgi:hypothetical protein
MAINPPYRFDPLSNLVNIKSVPEPQGFLGLFKSNPGGSSIVIGPPSGVLNNWLLVASTEFFSDPPFVAAIADLIADGYEQTLNATKNDTSDKWDNLAQAVAVAGDSRLEFNPASDTSFWYLASIGDPPTAYRFTIVELDEL